MSELTKKLRVLVVDDEPSVGGAFRRMLEIGYEVATVISAEAALMKLEAEQFDVVISDTNLGLGIWGPEFLVRVAERWPGMARVIMSGGDQEAARGALESGAAHVFLGKPWNPEGPKEAIAVAREIIAAESALMSDVVEDRADLLVVSHQAATRRLMEEQLRHRFAIATVESGAQALAFLRRSPVDLVIVECRMPEMNGLEFIRQARTIAPDAAYILLVDEADFAAALQDRLDLATDYVVRRPWDAHELCGSLMVARMKLISQSGR